MARQPFPSAAELALLDPDGQFRQRLADDRVALQALADGGQRGDLAALVHRLAGAAGTFGYAEIGEAAMALDDELAAVPETTPDVAPLLAARDRALAEKSV